MTKLLRLLVITAMLLAGGVVATANPNVDHLAGHGPNSGEFSAWTKLLANGKQIKFYAKYMQPGQKVQFMVQNESGVYEQLAWNRVDADDLNPDGSYANMQNHIYFIRTYDLIPGKNRVRILVDGEIAWGTKTYSLSEADALAPAWVQSASPADVEECKLPDPRPRSEQELYRGVRQGDLLGKDPVGFTDWAREGLLPTEGELNVIFAKIAFEDAPPSRSTIPDGYLQEQAQKMTDLGKHWSQGKFEYKFQVVDDWVLVPANHADFPVSAGDDVDHSPEAYALASENMRKVAQMVLDNLPTDLDFESAHLVVPVWSTNITEFTMPVTWRGRGLTTPDGKETNLKFMGNSTYMHRNLDYTWSVLAHDFLHLQGLNEHAPGPKFATHIGGQTTYTPKGMSPMMAAWETFLLGWFDDSQVHCITASGITSVEEVILTPLEAFGGERKTIVVPISEYRALVVESRRAEGYSSDWPSGNSGLLIYEVDTDSDHLDHGSNQCSNSRENPKWSYYLLPDGAEEAEDCNDPTPYFLRTGETLTYGGVKIELVHSGDQADYVRVLPDPSSRIALASISGFGEFETAFESDRLSQAARKEPVHKACSCCGCIPFGGN